MTSSIFSSGQIFEWALSLSSDRETDELAQMNESPDYRGCEICSRIDEMDADSQKIVESAEETFLAAAKNLKAVRYFGANRDAVLVQCPRCTTCYVCRLEHELLRGGEERAFLKRLNLTETLKMVKESLLHRKPTASNEYRKEPFSKIGFESVEVEDGEPDFFLVRYSQIDDGIEMGGHLRFEKQNCADLIDALLKLVYVYAQPETVIERGADKLTLYESGGDYQTFYNVLNRRAIESPNGGLTGLMMTRWAAEEMISKLLKSSASV